MKGYPCPNWPGHNCPRYNGHPCWESPGGACADSWTDEGCYVRIGDEWVWQGSDE